MEAKKVLLVFGTRPEAIKMAPLVKALKAHPASDARVFVASQYHQMLDRNLNFLRLPPNLFLAKSG